jgi:tripartite ATP-independent transporter DctM subunit
MLSIVMFIIAFGVLLTGIPVAFVFGSIALFFALISPDLGLDVFNFLPYRVYGIMQNFTLMAIPLFILMGLILEKSKIAENMLSSMGELLSNIRGGVAISVILSGMILATATGIVGASVVMMGIIALPIMIKLSYDRALASGTVLASGTLGQIIPPSIVLIILGDVLSVSVGDLFKSALVPSMILILLYILYIVFIGIKSPKKLPLNHELDKQHQTTKKSFFNLIKAIIPSLFLMIAVLGSIFMGIASPTESASIGVFGAIVLTIFNKTFSFEIIFNATKEMLKITGMVFAILFGATAFSLVFNELGGSDLILEFFENSNFTQFEFVLIAMTIIFILGFFIDFIEIAFVIVPILVPIMAYFNIDPVWFAILIAINLQTSFLTPPFGFALFFLKGAVKDLVSTIEIYKGVIPFILIQILTIVILILFPEILIFK